MVLESILAGGFVGIAGISYGLRQRHELSFLQQANAGMSLIIETKNLRIAELEKVMEDDRQKRLRISRMGGIATAKKRKGSDGDRRAATIDAVANAGLRPRDEVVADVRAARAGRDGGANERPA